jgi:RecB family exonuclease
LISLVKVPAKKHPIHYFAKRLPDSVRTAAVVPSKRNRRLLAACSHWEADIFTVEDFLSSVVTAKGVLLPDALRGYYIQKAAEALSEKEKLILFRSGEPLSSYSDYLKRSSTLLPFFREMCAERIDSALLAEKSVYNDYSEQIRALSAIWDNYNLLIKQDNFIDLWQTYLDFNLDEDFLSRYDSFYILVSGYLNKFEMELYRRLAGNRIVEIVFNFVEAEHRQEKTFKRFFGAETQREAGDTGIRWEKAERVKNTLWLRYNVGEEQDWNVYSVPENPSEIEILPAAGGFSQYELITERIFELHFDKQTPLNKMAVVLPSGDFSEWFLRSDLYRLYNVSYPETAKSFGFYQFLSSLAALLEEKTPDGYPLALLEKLADYGFLRAVTNKDFFEKMKTAGKLYTSEEEISQNRGTSELFSLISAFFDETDTYQSAVRKLLTLFTNLANFIEAEAGAAVASEQANREISVITDAAVYLRQLGQIFAHIKDEFPAAELLRLILAELAGVMERTGGKGVQVLGLIESRNLQFDYLFIPEMTSAFPRPPQDNLFLNSESREILGLPTFADRNELQKSYLYQLLARAKKTLITYPSGEDFTPSPFISEMAAKAKGWLADEKAFTPVPFTLVSFPAGKRFADKYDLAAKKTPEHLETLRTFKFSPSSLDAFRRCPRSFYYEHIARIRPPKTAVDSINMAELGHILHRTVRELFTRGFSPFSPEYSAQLRVAYDGHIKKYDYFLYDPVGAFYASSLSSTLDAIAAADRRHAESCGLIRQRFEERIEADYGGISLAGRIDRRDETGEGIFLIDYKFRSELPRKAYSGASFENPNIDIQLPLYALMLERKFGKPPAKLLWFDIKNTQSLVEGFNLELYGAFKEYLLSLINRILSPGVFEMPEKPECGYCYYKTFCPGGKK